LDTPSYTAARVFSVSSPPPRPPSSSHTSKYSIHTVPMIRLNFSSYVTGMIPQERKTINIQANYYSSMMMFSRAISRVKWLSGEKTNVSKIISVLVIRVLVWLYYSSNSCSFFPLPCWIVSAYTSLYIFGTKNIPIKTGFR
jgi:hypothetical protein